MYWCFSKAKIAETQSLALQKHARSAFHMFERDLMTPNICAAGF
jgi:hypothetical protein